MDAHEVHWLDLTGREPKQVTEKGILHVQEDFILDMCCVQDKDKQLLVAACDILGVSSYNTETDTREWNVCGKVPGMENDMSACGVTTDGRGYLFVGDTKNKCIQMFSVSDGQYLGSIMKGLGGPTRMQWCEKTSSIIAMCRKRKIHLKMISVQY